MKLKKMACLFSLLMSVSACVSAGTFFCSYLNLSDAQWTIRIQLSEGKVDNDTSKTIILPASQPDKTNSPVIVSMTTHDSTLSMFRHYSNLSGTIYVQDSNNVEQFFELILKDGSPYILHPVSNTGPVVLNQPGDCSIVIPKNRRDWGGSNYSFNDCVFGGA